MQLMYNNKAKESGVYVIGACGFDSIPAEMGDLLSQKKFEGMKVLPSECDVFFCFFFLFFFLPKEYKNVKLLLLHLYNIWHWRIYKIISSTVGKNLHAKHF